MVSDKLVLKFGLELDKVIVSYEDDKDKAATMLTMLPYPLGFVRPLNDMTATASKMEANGLIPIFVTFESTLGGKDFDELGEIRFWPRNREPVSRESQCVGGQSLDEFCSAEDVSDEKSNSECASVN